MRKIIKFNIFIMVFFVLFVLIGFFKNAKALDNRIYFASYTPTENTPGINMIKKNYSSSGILLEKRDDHYLIYTTLNKPDSMKNYALIIDEKPLRLFKTKLNNKLLNGETYISVIQEAELTRFFQVKIYITAMDRNVSFKFKLNVNSKPVDNINDYKDVVECREKPKTYIFDFYKNKEEKFNSNINNDVLNIFYYRNIADFNHKLIHELKKETLTTHTSVAIFPDSIKYNILIKDKNNIILLKKDELPYEDNSINLSKIKNIDKIYITYYEKTQTKLDSFNSLTILLKQSNTRNGFTEMNIYDNLSYGELLIKRKQKIIIFVVSILIVFIIFLTVLFISLRMIKKKRGKNDK